MLRGARVSENELVAFGTVGAVALDRKEIVAAATSTGGMTGKRWGRVGDSPIIGAGTYANNASCAVSATGHGEYFIRRVVAHDICAHMQYLKLPLRGGRRAVLNGQMKALGGNGGVIAIDTRGEVVHASSTARECSAACGRRSAGTKPRSTDRWVPCRNGVSRRADESSGLKLPARPT